jgi:hypothetical protein
MTSEFPRPHTIQRLMQVFLVLRALGLYPTNGCKLADALRYLSS